MSIASAIAVTGMSVATLRLQVSASNVANSLSDGPLPGSANAAGFPSAYAPLRVNQVGAAGGGTSATVGTVPSGYLPTYDPSAAYADGNGMVARPNVDLTSEIVQQLMARYAFAANAQVLRADTQATATLFNITA
jgi:flagellar basal-body rod protein FlgC